MPYGKKYKKKSKKYSGYRYKRKTYRKRSSYARKPPARRGATGLRSIQSATYRPASKNIRFTIRRTYYVTAAGTTPTTIKFLCNSPYLPQEATGTTGTWTLQQGTTTDNCPGLETWVDATVPAAGSLALYREGHCVSSSIKINARPIAKPTDSEAGNLHEAGFVLHKGTGSVDLPTGVINTTTNNFDYVSQFPNTKTAVSEVVWGGRNKAAALSGSYNFKRSNGLKVASDAIFHKDAYPSEKDWWTLAMYPRNNTRFALGDTPIQHEVTVQIDYICKLSEANSGLISQGV